MNDTDPDDNPRSPLSQEVKEPSQKPQVQELLDRLDDLEDTVDDPAERKEVQETKQLAERLRINGVGKRIRKYTSRDIAETFVGGILLSLPLLVEDGVFEIAEFFAEGEVFGVDLGFPLFLLFNIAFIVLMTVGLLYWADFRNLQDPNPLFGLIPRRLVGVLVVSFITAAFLLVLWGRHAEEDPTTLELFGRITVIWAAAAFGGALGDILPGESQGHDLRIENLDEIVGGDS